MKTIYLAATAAMLMASTAAHAGSNGNSVSFQIQGQKVHIELPKHCESLDCIQISAPGLKSGLKGLNLGGKSDDDSTSADTTPAPSAPPAPPPAPQIQAAAPAAPAAPGSETITSAASLHDSIPSAPPPAPTYSSQSTPVAAAPVATPAVAANTPIGVWKTEDDKGDIRIEQCGADLCGYAVGTGEKILINMHPADSKWVGRIHDPDSGRNYDSNIAMKGSNVLRVQGCALGGLFCGGQTWKRVS